MDPVRLSDVFVRPVYESIQTLNNPERTTLFTSGLIATNPSLSALALGGGVTGTVPFWRDLDPNIEPDYSNDDPADRATPDKVGMSTFKYRKSFQHKSWSSMDLVSELMAAEPLTHIRNRFDVYWTRQMQRRLIAMLVGLVADNEANDGGDMIVDISEGVGDLGVFNADAAIDAEYSLGDAVGGLTGMAVHSQVAKRMAKSDMFVYEKDSEGKVIVARYQDKVVVIDDSMPRTGSGATAEYLTALFGGGAWGFGGTAGHAFGVGQGAPKVPSYVIRDEEAGNGGGMETIGERNTWLLHPFGFDWEEPAGLVEFSPTLADLRLAGNWNRVVDRKQVPMAFIRSRA